MTIPPSDPRPEKRTRRRRFNAADEAQLSLLKPIANWQARCAWTCATWGIVPVAGLVLGALAVAFGLLGWRRVRRRPDDFGLRHAIGGMMIGAAELVVNAAGTYCMVRGIAELAR